MSPEELLFAKTHEWVHVESDDTGKKIATVGVSDFALEALTDLVYIELPEVGTMVSCGEPFGEIESVKAVSDLYSPVDGVLTAVHGELLDDLDAMKNDPYGAGWLVKVQLTDETALADLMDYASYRKQCAEEGV